MQRKSTAALCVLAILLACSRNGPPSSLFEAAGYHVGDGKVYYLNAFPGRALEIDGADVIYWSDGSVRPEDPEHFAIISTADHYLFAKDANTVQSTATHRRRRPADVSRRPRRHKLLRSVYFIRGMTRRRATRGRPEACRSAGYRTSPCTPG